MRRNKMVSVLTAAIMLAGAAPVAAVPMSVVQAEASQTEQTECLFQFVGQIPSTIASGQAVVIDLENDITVSYNPAAWNLGGYLLDENELPVIRPGDLETPDILKLYQSGQIKILFRDEAGTEVTTTVSSGKASCTAKQGKMSFVIQMKGLETGADQDALVVEFDVSAAIGWQKDDTGWKYYLEDGSFVKSAWKLIRSKWYHFDADGYMQKGWYKENNAWYYFKSDGSMAANEWVGGDKYFMDKSGKLVEAGWKKSGTNWWYQNADGTYPAGEWKKIDGKWYHFNEKGYMQTGWYQEGSDWYYLKKNGVMTASEWIENGKYYIGANGKWIQDRVQQGGTWKTDSKGRWYQFADGTYAMNQWKKIDGNWYHFGANGYMQTGWYQENGKTYYLKEDGTMASDEWVENNQYYIDANGVLQN